MPDIQALAIGDSTLDTFIFIDEEEADIQCNVRTHECEICFDLSDKIPVKTLQKCHGGNAANAAVSLSRLGIKTGIYTIIGDDDTGDSIWNNFKNEKISTHYITRHGKTNSAFIITVNGDRNIFSYHENRHYHLPKLPQVDLIYLTSMKDHLAETFKDVIEYCKKYKPDLTYNPGSYQLRQGITASQGILRYTNLLVLNKEEAAAWLEKPITTELKDLLTGLHAHGPKYVIITDGKEGAYGFDGNDLMHCPVYNHQRLETTGAGDSYASAASAALYHDLTLSEAMRWGSLNAHSVVNQIGGQAGLLKLSDMDYDLKQHRNNLKIAALTNE